MLKCLKPETSQTLTDTLHPFAFLYRRSSSNISGLNSEMCPDDQSGGFTLTSDHNLFTTGPIHLSTEPFETWMALAECCPTGTEDDLCFCSTWHLMNVLVPEVNQCALKTHLLACLTECILATKNWKRKGGVLSSHANKHHSCEGTLIWSDLSSRGRSAESGTSDLEWPLTFWTALCPYSSSWYSTDWENSWVCLKCVSAASSAAPTPQREIPGSSLEAPRWAKRQKIGQ